MQHTLVAVFENRTDAQSALTEMLATGFNRANIRLNDDTSGATESTGSTGSTNEHDEGFGASIGHFFKGLFGDDTSDEHKYSTAITRGHYVLTVTAKDEDEVERAAGIAERFNSVDIDEKAAGWAGASGMPQAGMLRTEGGNGGPGMQTGASLQSQMAQPGASLGQSSGSLQGGSMSGSQQRDAQAAAIPVVQEELKVGKREVQRGGVRVYSRIVETPVNESVNLREEHVSVERRPVDQPLSAANIGAFKEQTIELRESAEEAVVEKTARVVEEVVVGKQVTERQEEIRDTVRHTEVQVEQLGGASTGSDTAWRTHWSSNYGNTGGAYEDYAPAYTYGNQMANQYKGRQWNDVEGELRSDWDARNGKTGASTWEKFKGAIRQGWGTPG